MLVVADTSPISYLILIEEVEVLPKLYGRVLIPPQVLAELQSQAGPGPVRAWASNPQEWLEVKAPVALDMTLAVDEGQRAAICLASELKADQLLMDDRAGREVAARMGISTAGRRCQKTQAIAHRHPKWLVEERPYYCCLPIWRTRFQDG
ncbi:MAG TPA: hypothetical protein VGQ99_13630 [Tepidisphaeraceae bacterium]|jgi:predicted nucleic acid-binding protein|nr:hypothetical protein [Tepidisphaeraceae bacterium]